MGIVVSLDERREKEAEASLKPLLDLVQPDMERVNTIILDMAKSQVELIPLVADHLISSGGKRLRPMLTIAAAQMCGYDPDGDGHVKLAASVEFMHTATLLHDDVVDESDMRRGKPAARMVWGNQASVLVGDYLLGQAFRKMVEVGSLDALEVLSDAASIIAEGEVLQLAAASNPETTEEQYLTVIKAKTAALFAAAAEVGPILAGLSRTERNALKTYGVNLGYAFQLIDDALDYGGSSAKLGKETGDDFREGKITLPVILTLRQSNADERAFWSRTLKDRQIEDGDLEHAQSLMRKAGAVPETIRRAGAYGDLALEALSAFPESAHKKALIEVIGFCISRAH